MLGDGLSPRTTQCPGRAEPLRRLWGSLCPACPACPALCRSCHLPSLISVPRAGLGTACWAQRPQAGRKRSRIAAATAVPFAGFLRFSPCLFGTSEEGNLSQGGTSLTFCSFTKAAHWAGRGGAGGHEARSGVPQTGVKPE